MQKKRAFIFDMDGTLVDNMQHHAIAWQAALKDFGLECTMEQVHEKAFGKTNEALARFFGKELTEEFSKAFAKAKEVRYRELYRPDLSPIAGLIPFLDEALAQAIPMSIGTGSRQVNTDFVVDGLGIRHYFSDITTAEKVKNGKPNPETFLICAEALGVAPEDCVVFEDVASGAEAAMHAGMQCVVLTTTFSYDVCRTFLGNPKIIQDYNDIRVADFF